MVRHLEFVKTPAKFTVLIGLLLLSGLIALVPQVHAQGGVPLWTNYNDVLTGGAIAVDRTGNVFVAGEATGSNPNTGSGDGDSDIAVVAYSNDGVPLWTNVYAGPWNDRDSPHGIAVDNGGNVFVTGLSAVSGTVFDFSTLDWDYVTLAYSSNGVPLWTNYYSGPGLFDRPRAIAVDGGGNVFVTGFSDSSGFNTNLDYATIKYSNAGVALWTNRYNGPGNGGDDAAAIAVDSKGNVFVTGESPNSSGVYEFATVAYSGAGVPLWTNRYHGTGASSGGASAIAVDRSGNVFVTGSTYNSSSSAFATVAYSGVGVPLWTNGYKGKTYNSPVATAVDGSGNVIVTGWSRSGSDNSTLDYVTISYSAAGVPLWTNRYDGPEHKADEPSSIVVDSSGNVFVTGYSSTSNSVGFATLGYSRAGMPLWTSRCNGGVAGGIAVDSSGNVFVTGNVDGLGAVTIKYSSSVRPYLDIQRNSNQTVLSWTDAGFSLQSSSSMTDTFTNIPGASSPYTNLNTGPQQYFRLKAQ